ncbi:hypothetical protein CANINC_003186 [Pichia inconspicua]|uniref:RRM domain-containing protein n=1 Tax=Pichia inconspicua TaxID=52247 RepID=A0A4T0X0I1_9ASCO|nr:hypothetical protein CANINC_003186 [[Candida] inconspicua]
MSAQRLNSLDSNINNVQASWHWDFKDTNTVYVGRLPQELNEHDLLILMSQWGVPTNVIIQRDKDSGVSKGFGWVTFETWESTVLAVDNFDGWEIAHNHKLKVNHSYYRDPIKKDNENPEDDQNYLWQREVKSQLLDQDFASFKENTENNQRRKR